MKGALFLDRDGTLIADRHYIGDPTLVELLPGAAESIRNANARAVPVVVVTNQSGIGRGLITMEQYHAVTQRMVALLAEQHATIDANYHCPHWPETDGDCECRKPGLGMYRQAAREHHLVLSQSAYIGDRWRDVKPGIVSGGMAILVPSDDTPADDIERAGLEARVIPSLIDATNAALDFIDAGRDTQSASGVHDEMKDDGN